jgi:signal transduction histidine kinase/CheY-like chemotaxis protein
MAENNEHPGVRDRAAQALLRVLDRFLAPALHRADSDTLNHARVVTTLTASLLLVSLPYIPFYLWLGTKTCAAVLSAGCLAALGILALVRFTGRMHLAGNCTLGAYLATVTAQSCFQGGAIGPKFLWYLPIPLLAIFLARRRWAVFWAASTFACMSVFFALYLAGYRFRNDLIAVQNTAYALHLIGLSAGIFMMGWFHDSLRDRILTQLRSAKDAAEVATQAKSAFLANMSHEIRTPMAAILGFTDELLDPSTRPDDRREAVETIQRNGQHLLQLLNNILDLSKIEAGKLTVDDLPCRLPDLLTELHPLMHSMAVAKGLGFRIEIEGAIPEVISTDPTRLRQILINLVNNAVKFTRAGEVRLVVRRRRASAEAWVVEFDVIDTGIGIRRDEIERLFCAFEQADSSTTREFGGTGLGLTISRSLARKLGGDIVVTSRPGRGSTFRASVLAACPEGEVRTLGVCRPAAPEIAGTRPGPAEQESIRVLVAEDGPDNQKLITLILRRAGIEVDLAQNGQEAVLALFAAERSERPYDLVLMDMQMPVMDGYEASRTIRDAGRTIPIIALTANAMSGDREKCLEAGCTEFATKPINRAVLLELIRRFARDRHEAPPRELAVQAA